VAGANSSHGWETTSAECRINFSHLLVTANGASRNFPRDMKNSGEEKKTKKKKKKKKKKMEKGRKEKKGTRNSSRTGGARALMGFDGDYKSVRSDA